jgi:hypothetical protein
MSEHSNNTFAYPPVAEPGSIESKFPSPVTMLDSLSLYFTLRYGRNDDGAYKVEHDPIMFMLASAVNNCQILRDAVLRVASTDNFSCPHVTHSEGTTAGETAQQFATRVLSSIVRNNDVPATMEDFISRDLNKTFMYNMAMVVMQSQNYEAVLKLISENVYLSCVHEVYRTAGNGEGVRILTPREGAQFMIEQLQKIEANSKPKS